MVAVTESGFFHPSWWHYQQQVQHIPLHLVLFYPEADHPGPSGHGLLSNISWEKGC